VIIDDEIIGDILNNIDYDYECNEDQSDDSALDIHFDD
jgi:hypothetical protein